MWAQAATSNEQILSLRPFILKRRELALDTRKCLSANDIKKQTACDSILGDSHEVVEDETWFITSC